MKGNSVEIRIGKESDVASITDIFNFYVMNSNFYDYCFDLSLFVRAAGGAFAPISSVIG